MNEAESALSIKGACFCTAGDQNLFEANYRGHFCYLLNLHFSGSMHGDCHSSGVKACQVLHHSTDDSV